MKPICVPCRRFFRPLKCGTYFVEGMPNKEGARPGLVDPDSWSPYKLWCGDVWVCPDCRVKIIVGVGRDRIAEHYEPTFIAQVASLGVEIQINDC